MPRWEPNPRERLEAAAIELFAERGFDTTTVDDIAARAGLAKSGFFRHFRNKRDVLSGGHDALESTFSEAVRAAPPAASLLDALLAGFAALEPIWFPPERRALAPKRGAAIAASVELQERELLKLRSLADAVIAALVERGADPLGASVAAELSTLAYVRTTRAWSDATSDERFSDIARRELAAVTGAAASIAG